jgi:hypothetical protein
MKITTTLREQCNFNDHQTKFAVQDETNRSLYRFINNYRKSRQNPTTITILILGSGGIKLQNILR